MREVAVDGPPWDLRIAARWTAQITPAAGEPYDHEAVHWLRIRRGAVVELHAFADSQLVAERLRRMADAGVQEASAPPLR